MKTAIVLLSIFALAIAKPEPRNFRSTCGTTLTTSSGSIESPNFPSNYGNNVDCTSIVRGIPGKELFITFTQFNVESHSSCGWDKVELFDGNTLMHTYCGSNAIPVFKTSMGNDFKLVFHTDGSVTKSGFQLTFDTTPPPPPTGTKPTTCGQVKVTANGPFPSNRIVGGTISNKHAIPWQISLQRLSGSTWYHSCGGSVISDTYIVTAAHCVDDGAIGSMRVVAGAHSLSSTETTTRQTRNVKRASWHENYSTSTSENDIAILELDSKLTFDTYVQPICMPSRDVSRTLVETVTVSGWGTLSSGGSSPDLLQYVDVPTVADAICDNSNFYDDEFKPASMICAGVYGRDSCQGDSGGPLYKKETDFELKGVVSWGYGCAGANKPGVYARAYAYRDWVNTQTGINF